MSDSKPKRIITPLDDRILEAFDADAGMRDGLLAVYELGRADALSDQKDT